MISSAVRSPRICLACRLTFARRHGSPGLRMRRLAGRDGVAQWRRYSDEKSKETLRIEALISSGMSFEEAQSKYPKPKEKKAKLPDWGLTGSATKKDKQPAASHRTVSDASTSSDMQRIEHLISGQIFERQDDSRHHEKERNDVGLGDPELFRLSGEDGDPAAVAPTWNATESSESSARNIEGGDEMAPDPKTNTLDFQLSPETRTDTTSTAPAADAHDEFFSLPDLDDLDDSEFSTKISAAKKFRHHLLHHTSVGVQALGVDMDAVILNNPNQMQYGKKKKKKFETELAEEPAQTGPELDWKQVELEKSLDGEAESLRQEVWANINELRPTDTTVLRMTDFMKLRQELVGGFTLTQLKDYFQEFDDGQKIDSPVENLANYSWITEQSPWTPVNSLPVLPKETKPDAAQKILLSKWNLEIQDFVSDVGRASIRIEPRLFFLAFVKSSHVIESLRRNLIIDEDDESIQLSPKECRIDITARKAATYAILDRINVVHNLMQERILSVSHQQLSPSLLINELKEISRVTGCLAEPSHEQTYTRVRVSWLPANPFVADEPPPNPEIEDMSDIVLRLLVGHPIPPLERKLDLVPPNRPLGSGGQFIVHHRETRSMSWRQRLRTWHRYVVPINKSQTETPPGSLKLAEILPAVPAYDRIDKNKLSKSTTAIFGHVLHSSSQVKDMAGLSRRRRTISPVVPHPASFSALQADDGEDITRSTTIVLNFAPEDTQNQKSSRLPAVKLRLPVDDNADLEKFAVPENATFEAIAEGLSADVMLPEHPVDVRVIRHLARKLDITHEGIRDFLSKCQFNLLQGDLRTPTLVDISLPQNWMHYPKGRSKSVVHSYSFRGLEIHQSCQIPWRGHTLRYSSVEAGQHGGQRQELSLQAGPPEEPNGKYNPFLDTTRASFFECVEDIVTGKCFSWTRGYESVKVDKFKDFSHNLPAQEFGEGFVVSEVPDEQGAVDESISAELDSDSMSSRAGFEVSDESRPGVSDDDSFESKFSLRRSTTDGQAEPRLDFRDDSSPRWPLRGSDSSRMSQDRDLADGVASSQDLLKQENALDEEDLEDDEMDMSTEDIEASLAEEFARENPSWTDATEQGQRVETVADAPETTPESDSQTIPTDLNGTSNEATQEDDSPTAPDDNGASPTESPTESLAKDELEHESSDKKSV